MKRILIVAALLLATVLLLAACGGAVQFKLNFIVDGEVYATIDTSGNESIKLPENPTKEGEVFDGWYWDKDTWQKPFTANSLLDAPLSSDMNVYAKWKAMDSGEQETEEPSTPVPTEPDLTKAEIVSAPLFAIDGQNLSLTLPNATESFSFIGQITVSEKATWQISTDMYGLNSIPTKTVPLNIEDNTFYLLVTSGDANNINLYTVKIRRRPIYTVSFNTANGTAVAAQQVEESYFVAKPSDPKRTGYTFAGWDYDFATPITGNTKITAAWKTITYTITYELNGGTNAASNPPTYTIEDDTITFANPTRTGYNFTGWSISSIPHGSTENRTITASWTPTVYTITYELNGGTNAATNPATYTIETATIVFADPTRAGYNFAGWSISSIPQGSTENRTITANWSDPNVYTVTYHLNGGTNVASNPETYTVENGNVTLANPTRTGYTFGGWYEDDQFATKITTIQTSRLESLNIYADWVANTYTIIYTNTDDSGAYDFGNKQSQMVIYDSVFNLLPAQERIGNTFLGWYYGEQQVTSGIWQIPNNVTLTAKWEEDSALAPFTYSSTATACQITGVKDKTVTELVVPDYVTSISEGAFRGCSGLTSVTLGNSVTSIGNYAFKDCSGLTSVTIPNSVTSIGNRAFSGCSGLTSVTIGNSVTSIGNSAFYKCSGLTTVNWNATNCTSAGSSPAPIFEYCTNLKTINIGENVTTIPAYAFYNCRGLTSITIPNSVTSIGDWAFFNCSGLTSVTIGNSVTSIGKAAFCYCYKLIEVHNLSALSITAGSESNGYVGYYAKHIYQSGESYLHTTDDGYLFYENGEEVYLMAYIGNQTNLTLPANYNGKNYAINQYAFSGCSGLTSVVIPNSVTNIGRSAFSGCSGLTSVTIGNSVTSIGIYAFSGCSGLTSVTIGNSVTSIGYDAFYNCSGLTSVTFANTSGWYRTQTQNATSGTNMNVTNASTNASNLKTNYYEYYWYRR